LICTHTRVTEHTFDNGVVTQTPTLDTAGEKTYTCTVCGTTKVVELEYYVPEISTETEATVSESDSSSPAETQGDGLSIVSILIGVAVGAVITAGIFLVAKKKR